MKKRWFLILAAIVSIGLGLALWSRSRSTQKTPRYREVTAELTTIRVTARATGTVQPENRLEIKPPIAGRMEKVLVQEGDSVRKSQVLAWMSSTERAAVLDAARAKGPEELAKWEDLYRPTPILSPLKATVIRRNVEPGQTFASSDAIIVLSNHLTVKAQVDETDLAQVQPGVKASIALDAYPQSQIDGRVSRIAFEAKAVNNVTMYEVDVMPETIPPFMRSGMTATIEFKVAEKNGILAISNDAIRSVDGKLYVSKKTEADPQEIEIKAGLSDGKVTEVLSGLSAGDIVLAPMLGDATTSTSTNPFMPSRPRRVSK
ncbi:MAG: efflux RND transporter periplasmic adaptor subunit [Bdellovibrionaceae bacterium]|nr:efflux RND transporter periplasmic adaptor subunit [Pseudobdellovibrionaceae bacterium]